GLGQTFGPVRPKCRGPGAWIGRQQEGAAGPGTVAPGPAAPTPLDSSPRLRQNRRTGSRATSKKSAAGLRSGRQDRGGWKSGSGVVQNQEVRIHNEEVHDQ